MRESWVQIPHTKLILPSTKVIVEDALAPATRKRTLAVGWSVSIILYPVSGASAIHPDQYGGNSSGVAEIVVGERSTVHDAHFVRHEGVFDREIQ